MANKEVWEKYKDKPEYNWLKNKYLKKNIAKCIWNQLLNWLKICI